MNHSLRYIVLYILWVGVVFGYYLCNRDDMPPEKQPQVVKQPSIGYQQMITLEQQRFDALKKQVDTKTETLIQLENQIEELTQKARQRRHATPKNSQSLNNARTKKATRRSNESRPRDSSAKYNLL